MSGENSHLFQFFLALLGTVRRQRRQSWQWSLVTASDRRRRWLSSDVRHRRVAGSRAALGAICRRRVDRRPRQPSATSIGRWSWSRRTSGRLLLLLGDGRGWWPGWLVAVNVDAHLLMKHATDSTPIDTGAPRTHRRPTLRRRRRVFLSDISRRVVDGRGGRRCALLPRRPGRRRQRGACSAAASGGRRGAKTTNGRRRHRTSINADGIDHTVTTGDVYTSWRDGRFWEDSLGWRAALTGREAVYSRFLALQLRQNWQYFRSHVILLRLRTELRMIRLVGPLYAADRCNHGGVDTRYYVSICTSTNWEPHSCHADRK